MAFGMSNPLLNDKRFKPDSTDESQAGWASPTAGAGAASATLATAKTGVAGGQAPPPVSDGRVMTVGGTVRATLLLWAIILVSGVYGWNQVSQVAVDRETGQVLTGSTESINAAIASGTAYSDVQFPGWVFIPMLVAFGLAIVAMLKPKLAPVLSPLYALGYGVVLGAISALYELQFNGIVLQAILATLGVFGVMMFLYASRIIKVTKKFAMVVVGATAGIFVMYLVGIVASMFGVDLMFYNQPSALGIGISVVICIVAALNLALDFAFIESATERRMPSYMNWMGALGITITIVWLYLELLRLIALTRR